MSTNPLLATVQRRLLLKRLDAALGGRYAANTPVRQGTIVSASQVAVNGTLYDMDSSNLGLEPGAKLNVKNVQRLASARYVPADAWGGAGKGGGGIAGVTSVTAGPGLQGGGTGAVTLQVGEGPGIAVTGTTVGLGGDSVLLADSGGAVMREYPATATGFAAALAAAASGDRIDTPAGTLAGDHTIPAGVFVSGPATTFSGAITNNGVLLGARVAGTLTNNGLYVAYDATVNRLLVNGQAQAATAGLEVWGKLINSGDAQINVVAHPDSDSGAGVQLDGSNLTGGRKWLLASSGPASGEPSPDLGAGSFCLWDATDNRYALVVLPSGHMRLGVGNDDDLAHLAVVLRAADVIGQVVRGYVGQTANLQEWQTIAGAVLAAVAANGQLVTNVATGTAPLAVSSSTRVANLNADMVDGKHSNEMVTAYHLLPLTNSTGDLIVDTGGNLVPTRIWGL